MKFYGTIGFAIEEETAPGVWKTKTEEQQVYGDVLSNTRRWDNGQEINSDLNVSNKISVVASRFIYEHLGAMHWLLWNGTKWKISSAEIVRPRVILTLGGVYNGE